jgi:two-component system sensor histidine kinase DegS
LFHSLESYDHCYSKSLGFLGALRSFVGDWSRLHGIPGDFKEFGLDALQLSPAVEIHLFRIVQEALTNVFKHANASHVEVGLHEQQQRIVLTVADNGVGFDPNVASEHEAGSGAGLIGMRERVWSIHGELEIDARPGHGTTVIVTVPVDEGVLSANE